MFLTIEMPDTKGVKQNLKPKGHFNLSAKGSDDSPCEFDLELFDVVYLGGVWLLLLKFSPGHIKRLTFK